MAPYSPPSILFSSVPLASPEAQLMPGFLSTSETRFAGTLRGVLPIRPTLAANVAAAAQSSTFPSQNGSLESQKSSSHVSDDILPMDLLLALLLLTPGRRRVRLGSLFLTHSIWNDDSHLPLHAPSLFHDGLFLSPALTAQPLLLLMPLLPMLQQPLSQQHQHHQLPTRNRSHTTTGASHLGPMPLDGARVLPFMTAHDTLLFFDNLVYNLDAPGRNRAQTFLELPPAPPALLPHDLDELTLPIQPLLLNDFDFSDVVVTTNFENPSLGPTSTLLFDNVPLFVDAANLCLLMHNSTGAMHGRGILSVRVSPMALSKMALVECASIEVAMALKASFNHLEIVPGVILYVAFARLAPAHLVPPMLNVSGHSAQSALSGQSVPSVSTRQSSHSVSSYNDDEPSLVTTVSRLLLNNVDLNKVRSLMRGASLFPKSSYRTNFGPLPEPIPLRQFDSPKLRELRKMLENNERALQSGRISPGVDDAKIMSQLDLEDLSLAMLDELPELCHDHIGNTIVQKIFSVMESPFIKLMMVKEISPYLAQLSIHKNGTWAIQKIINLCHDDVQQKVTITDSLRPYAVKLFNDQFGNYVLQCCLKFGSPYNDFIFETMLDNFIEISSGRFGARCIRTILETANDPKSAAKGAVTPEQVFLVASLIVEYANDLAVNSNGLLLITWFLDTFTGCRGLERDNRYELLCEKFLPHLDKLCTHKLANLTIFKILNNRSDYRVKQVIMDAIFGAYDEFEDDDFTVRPPSPLLETILLENLEHNAGSLFIYKILSNPILLSLGDEFNSARYQQYVVSQVKRVLLEMNIVNLQPYKKLVDEVGLSTNRLNRTSSNRKKRSGARNGKGPSSLQQMQPPHMTQMPPLGYMNNGFSVYPGSLYPPGPSDMPRHPNAVPVLYAQQFQQDMTVMQQLEQLSLSLAALGYTSNPGTPNPGEQGQFF